MKKIVRLIFVAGSLILISYNGSIKAASETHLPVIDKPANIGQMMISEFVKLSVNDFTLLSGKKLSLKEKVSFSLMKKDMKKTLKKKGDITVNDYITTVNKKNNTALIIVIIVVVLIIIGVIIANSIDIDLGGLGEGG